MLNHSKVEGQGFKFDVTRLTAHSKFLREMFFDDTGRLGLQLEGSSLHDPLVIEGCTAEAFANFLGWLNHKYVYSSSNFYYCNINTIWVVASSSWSPLKTDQTKQLLDILHVSHMWEIAPGVEFASTELLKANLHPAHRLRLARQYGLLDWIEIPIRILLESPLARYTEDSHDNLDFSLYMVIATAKESIATARKVLANIPPFPTDADNTPFCPQHATCKRIWVEKWFIGLGRRIHHPTEKFALAEIPQALETMDHRGMNEDCKKFVLKWMNQTLSYLIQREEDLIQETVDTVRIMFM
jgi:hypothetical protein